MAFHLRSLSARRYRVEGTLPSIHDDAFLSRLRARRFESLADDGERAVGWVTADNCLDTEFTVGTVSRGPCAVFAMRVDRRRPNPRLLRAMVDLEMRGRRKDADVMPLGGPLGDDDVADDSGGASEDALAAGPAASRRGAGRARRGGGALGARARAEVRRAIADDLRRRTTPHVAVLPVLLYPRERTLLFGSVSRPANEAFRLLFTETFEVALSALTPYHRALELLAANGRAPGEALAAVRRTDFAPTQVRSSDGTTAEFTAALRATRHAAAEEARR